MDPPQLHEQRHSPKMKKFDPEPEEKVYRPNKLSSTGIKPPTLQEILS